MPAWDGRRACAVPDFPSVAKGINAARRRQQTRSAVTLFTRSPADAAKTVSRLGAAPMHALLDVTVGY
jgi:hypothetical protein